MTAAPAHAVDAATLKRWIDAGEAVVVDVREPDEHAREHIPGARLEPLSRFDPARARGNGHKVVLHCKSGRRSAEALARLGPGAGAFHLQGGLEAWKQAGLPVEANPRAPISIMRQVQITAGTFVLAGTALGVFVSPWFLIVPAFFGAGLAFAGASGTCGMAALLWYMPWNRALRGAACG